MNPADALKAKARDWAKKVVILHNTKVPPEMEGRKQALLKAAKVIKTGIEKIFGSLEEFEQIQLGAIPLIVPVAVIAAAAAAITKWTLDYKKFMHKVTLQNNLIAGGANPDEAAKVIAQLDNKSKFADTILKKVALPIVGLGILYNVVTK